DFPGCDQGQAGVRRGKEGFGLQSRHCVRSDGQEERIHRAVRTDLRGRHRLQRCAGEGGEVLFGAIARLLWLGFTVYLEKHGTGKSRESAGWKACATQQTETL